MRIVYPALLIATASVAFAQTVPSFEVASVKVNAAGPMGREGRVRPDAIAFTPGGVTMTGVTMRAIVQWAYHMQSIQVSGPSWIDDTRYDINAKAATPVSSEELRKMMQTLLTNRFKLAFHRDTKEMSAYVVTIAKGGHKMTQSVGEGDMQIKPTGKGLIVQVTHVTLAQLSEMSASPLQGVVVDQTGLSGAWDFQLDASSFMVNQPSSMEEAINLFVQALGEQVGLKVEQKKVPAEVFVIDRAEKTPVEN
jgi:uncharacterized protein (TIGR03435 family)